MQILLREHRVPADRAQYTVRRNKLSRRRARLVDDATAIAALIQSLGAAIGDQRHRAQPRLDRGHGVDQMGERRATADHCAVDMTWRDAQVLAHQQRVGAVVPVRENPIDIGQGEAGIGQGVTGRATLQR
ncbi:hypothetical protein D9M71_694900 [compost metagenome]